MTDESRPAGAADSAAQGQWSAPDASVTPNADTTTYDWGQRAQAQDSPPPPAQDSQVQDSRAQDPQTQDPQVQDSWAADSQEQTQRVSVGSSTDQPTYDHRAAEAAAYQPGGQAYPPATEPTATEPTAAQPTAAQSTANQPTYDQNQASGGQYAQNQPTQNQYPQNQYAQSQYGQYQYDQSQYQRNQYDQGQYAQNQSGQQSHRQYDPNQYAQNQAAGSSQSHWWVANAASDPWRDPGSAPTWVAPVAQPNAVPTGSDRPATPPEAAVGGRSRWWTPMLVAIIVAVVAGPLGGAVGYVAAVRGGADGTGVLGGGNGATPASANRSPESVAGIAKRVQPGTVAIAASGPSGRGNGSGFVIRKDGYIATNNHVVEGAAGGGGALKVTFSDGTSATATVAGRDPISDLAVIKVPKTNLTTLEMGNSDKVAVGDPVLAVGSPLGLQSTVTTGIVSALDRPVVTGADEEDPGQPGTPPGQGAEPVYTAAIQTDAAINPGNSGGPLLDAAGRVIGVDSSIAQVPGGPAKGSIGLGFAIPGNLAKRIFQQLITSGKAKRTVLGAEVDPAELPSGGARVGTVPAGPAQQAGLRAGDVITKFNGKMIGDAVELIALIRKLPAGTSVTLAYTRGGQASTANIRLTESS